MSNTGQIKLPSKPKGYKSVPSGGDGRDKGTQKRTLRRPPTPFDDDVDAILERLPDVNKPRVDLSEYTDDDDFDTGLQPGKSRSTTTFPSPPSFKMAWETFSRYWEMCWDNPKTRPRMKVYIYRTFPVMKEGHRQVDILYGAPEGEQRSAKPVSQQDMLHRYGTGDYHFKMNDAQNNNQQICQCNLTGSAMRDYINHFPVIDIAGVDEVDPLNKTFMLQLRQRGQAGLLSEEDDMEAASIIGKLTDAILHKDERDDSRSNQERQSKSSEDGEAVKLMAYAAQQSIDLVSRTKDAHKSESAPVAPPQNPLDMLNAVMVVAEKLRPDNTALVEALKQASSREQDSQARYNQLMMKMMERSNEPPEDPIAKLIKLTEAKDQLSAILGTGRAKSGTDWAELASSLAPIVAPAMGTLQALVMAMLSKGAGSGSGPMQGMHQQALPGAPQGFGGAPGTQQPNQQPQTPPGASSGPNEQPGQPQQPGQPGLTEDEQKLVSQGVPIEFTNPERIATYLENIRGPLLRIMNNQELDGSDFAQWLIDWKGEEHYLAVAKAGKETISQLMFTHPAIMADLQTRPMAFGNFLDEFIAVSQQTDDGGDDDSDDEYGNENDDNGSNTRQASTPASAPITEQRMYTRIYGDPSTPSARMTNPHTQSPEPPPTSNPRPTMNAAAKTVTASTEGKVNVSRSSPSAASQAASMEQERATPATKSKAARKPVKKSATKKKAAAK